MANSMSEVMNPNLKTHDADFPHAPEGWTRADAEATAKAEGLSMDQDHWAAVRALQDYYARNEGEIHVRKLHDALDERFHGSGGMKFLYHILPGGPVAQGCRLAGLEPPAGASDKSFGSVQ
jgi:tRNA 2-thiouridine synthesizing protein E